jgi:WD40 repeat protein
MSEAVPPPKPQPAWQPPDERAEHALCLGRDGVLRELDRLLFEQAAKVVRLRGEPGRGKSALLSQYLQDLERGVRGGPPPSRQPEPGLLSRLLGRRPQAEARRVPHVFLRREAGATLGTSATEVAAALAEQIEALYPECRDPQAGPEARLCELLSRLDRTALAASKQRLVPVVDGIDAVRGSEPGDEAGELRLMRLLPQPLPDTVAVLCAADSREPLAELGLGDGVDVDLEDPCWQGEAAVAAFWKHHAERMTPRLPEAVWREVAARSDGNLLHAALVRALFLTLPAEQRTLARVPRGLRALWAELWRTWQAMPNGAGGLVGRGLSLLHAARAPLPAAALERLLGSSADVAALLRLARPAIAPLPPGSDGTTGPEPVPPWLRLQESLRDFLRGEAGADWAQRQVAAHEALVEALCPWPLPGPSAPRAGETNSALAPFLRRYALRHGAVHRLLAGDLLGAAAQLLDVGFLTLATRELSAESVATLLREATEALSPEQAPLASSGDWAGRAALAAAVQDLGRAVRREAYWLRREPEALPGLLYNRLVCQGWSAADIESRLRWPSGLPAVRLAAPLQPAGSARWRSRACGAAAAPAGSGAGDGGPVGVQRCLVLPGEGDAEGAVLIGRSDGTVALWALAGAPRARWIAAGHHGAVHALVRLPGRRAASAGADGLVKVWDLQTGREHLTVRAHAGAVHTLWARPDGRLLTGGSDGRVRLWDERGTPLVSLAEGGVAVLAVAALPDGRVVAASEDRQLRLWAADGRLGGPLSAPAGTAHTLPVSQLLPLSTGELVTASLDGTLKVWRLPDGATPGADGAAPLVLRATLRGHGDGVSACAELPGGRLLSASLDGTLRVFSLTDGGAPRGVCEGHAGWVTDCAILPPGRGESAGTDRAVSVSLDGTLKVWDLTMAERLHALCGHQGFVTALQLLPDGKRLLSASRDRTLKLWDVPTGRHLRTLSGHAASVDECVVLPEAAGSGPQAVSASYDATLKAWDLATGQVLATMQGHSGWVSGCAALPDPRGGGARVLSAAMDGTVRLWDARSGQQLKSLVGHSDSVTTCAVLPDGERVVSASADGTLRIWHLLSGQQLQVLHGHKASVDRCTVLPGSGEAVRVLSASADSTLKLWDAGSGAHVLTLAGHTAWISACDVVPGRSDQAGEPPRVVSASGDETLRIWDLASGQALHVLRGHHAPIYACAAMPAAADGRRRVVSAGGDGALKVWDADSGACLATVYGTPAGFFSVRAVAGWIFAGDVLGNVWMLRC